mgnify:CR=1 FL=1
MRAGKMALVVAFAPLFFAAVLTVATLVAPEYNSFSDTTSMLMGPGIPHPWVLQLGVVGYALLIQFLGPLLYSQAGRGRHGAFLWALVFIYSLVGILAAAFRDGYDAPLLWHISENTVHDFVARLSFSAVLLLIFFTPWALRHQEGWHIWRWFSLAVGILTIVLIIPFEVEMWPSYLGLIQRVLFATTLLWILVTAFILRSELPNSLVRD